MVRSSMSSARPFAKSDQNRLLNLLPPPDRDALLAVAEHRAYSLGDVLIRRDKPITWVIFPTTCVGSVLTIMADGTTIETGTIGNEGFIGIPIVLGVDREPNETVCQVAGSGIAVPARHFASLLAERESLRQLLLRYTQAFLIQGSQSTACNRLHTVDERYARWVLMTHDRTGRDTFALTQEFLAMMLGVRRASVSVAASRLKSAGIIDYHRGGVTVLDRARLEEVACECYSVSRGEYDRLLGSKHSEAR